MDLQFWDPEAGTVMGHLRNQYNRVTSNKVQTAENARVCVCVCVCVLSHGRSTHFILIYIIIAVLDCKYFT